ncbi:DHA2 family efflux MFS transporter permease subunit [Arhodomonas aquaeolei]|uniref:DHA2 family efflux MFS transporter permease subunit n=1 Tax=Arhodomonas aquaeolei TaxID=2369 RepID=UPI000371B188|nr:DHA2 family efflux MFS transporter permease subunit [Arhodomonas aquaeolei]
MTHVTDMPPWSQRLGFVAAVFGMFMAILDIQIVASSLNEIQAGVSATEDQISWVQTAYLIAEVVMIPLSGMLTRILSTRVAFVVSCGGFTLASLGCAMASSVGTLITLRAVQGFLGGAMIPIAYAISFSIFPRRVMGSVQAVMGLVATMAPSIGPTIGGYITQTMSYHWLFLVNVLPGILVSLAIWNTLALDHGNRSLLRRLDVPGLVFMAVFLGTLEYILEEGPGDDWFASALIRDMSVLCAVAGVAFFVRMFRTDHPIVDLHAFRNRNFAIGAALGFCLGIALYGLTYLMPLFFGIVRQYNALQIGEIMFVTGAAMFVCAPIAGRASDHIDPRILLAIGLTLVGTGTVMNAHMTSEAGYELFFWPQVIRGAGMVLCMIPITRIALGTLPPHEVGNASGLFNVLRNLGGAFGLAMMDTIRDVRFDFHWSQIIPAIDTGRATVVHELQAQTQQLTGAVADPRAGAIANLARRIGVEAQTMAFNDIFLWLGMIYLCAVPVMLLMKRPTMATGEAGH